jgi:N-acetyl-alpha-D-muramate 1-phosphate uridylyltransferase
LPKPHPLPLMILAAGRGERMRPLTDTTPKPMLKVRGKPLIQWHLESAAAAGITEVVINTAHLGEQIESFLGDGDFLGLQIRYSREPLGALETAGGIATARPWQNALGTTISDHFLVVNSDIWTDWPFEKAMAIRDQLQASSSDCCHLVLVTNPPQHPQGDFSLGDPIPNWPGTHRTQPKNLDHSLTFSGIGVYDRAMFEPLAPGQHAPLAPMLHQAIMAQRCVASLHQGYWSDVGTPERLEALNQS